MPNHVVLYQPEIPQNTGNIMRTCVGTNTTLHLIKPLGFSLDENHIKRSGANYVKDCNYILYENWEDFLSKNEGEFFYLTRYGHKTIYDVDCGDYSKNYYFVLGKESTGIPYEILQENIDKCIRFPMTNKIRALNVSNVCCTMVYEALRQQGFPNLEFEEPEIFKGKDYLHK